MANTMKMVHKCPIFDKHCSVAAKIFIAVGPGKVIIFYVSLGTQKLGISLLLSFSFGCGRFGREK